MANRRTRFYGIGWEYVHVAIDDYTRIAYAEVLRDEKARSSIAFLRRARDWYARHGIQIQRVLSDMAPATRTTLPTPAPSSALAPADQGVHSANERQGGAAHPDAAPRMGVSEGVPEVPPPYSSSATLPALLQPQAAARRMRCAHADEEIGARRVNKVMRNDT
jgi:hypothetical protein